MTTKQMTLAGIKAMPAGEAKTLLREMVKLYRPLDCSDWIGIVEAAKASELVDWVGHKPSTHEHARKLHRVSPSQILDRMNVDALLKTYWSAKNAVFESNLVHAFKVADTIYGTWPYSEYSCTLSKSAYGTEVSDDYAAALDSLEKAANTTTKSKGTPMPIIPSLAIPSLSNPYAGLSYDEELLMLANGMLRRATNSQVQDFRDVVRQFDYLSGLAAEEIRKAQEAAANVPAPVIVAAPPPPVAASGDVPAGEPVMRSADDIFGSEVGNLALLGFQVTTYQWEAPNPYVPAIDPHYLFDPKALAELLYAWETKQNAWLVGHTGTGKTTLVEQAAARLGYMVVRLSFDVDISRMEFVGKVDVKTDDDGNSITAFTEGVLPRAMQMPCILLLDEADAIRGDIGYVLQPVLEGGNLRLLEDGGRIVQRDPGFRIVATANTAGGGDASGLYSAGVKVQSAAAMNRYNLFIPVDYMPADAEVDMCLSKAGGHLQPDLKDGLMKFLTFYRKSFADGEIVTPISPRTTLALVKYMGHFGHMMTARECFESAVKAVVENRLGEEDIPTLRGILDRSVNL